MNKKHIQAAIDALKRIENDDFIAAKVAELQAHADTMEDDSSASEDDDSGGSNPPPGKTRG